MEGQKIWKNILAALKIQVSSSTFKAWFVGSFVLDYKNDQGNPLLIIAVKNNFLKEQIETRYFALVKKLAVKATKNNVNIAIVVSEKKKIDNLNNEPIFSGIPQKFFLNQKRVEALSPGHTFENFVIGPPNNLAYVAAKQIVNNPLTSYNPLLIYGPTGVGKTHLLQAIGNEALNTIIDAKIIYASAEKFTNDYINSLSNKTQASFRLKYREVNLLLIDDIQFLAGKESTQNEFFYTFNELHLAQRQIVIVSDRHPSKLGGLKERLISRFLGGMTVDIGLPDIEMKEAIIKTKCAERGINLTSDIISFIGQSCQGGARELEGMLTSVLAMTKISGGKISQEEIVKLISKSNPLKNSCATPEKIIKTVCNHFNIKEEDLEGPSRKASLVLPRQILMYLLRKDLNLPLEQIGQIIGGRDHSTIIHGVEKMEGQVVKNQKLGDEVLRLRSMSSQ